MKMRIAAMLLVVVLAVGLLPVTAGAAGEDTIIVNTLSLNNGTWSESEWYTYLSDIIYPGPGDNFVSLHYGTYDDHTPLVGGTLSSSDPDIVKVTDISSITGFPAYSIEVVGFGDVTLTYADDSATYSVSKKVELSLGGELFSEKNRSESTYLRTLTYDPVNGNTAWIMCEGGFGIGRDTLSIKIDGKTFAGAKVVYELRNDTDVYDIKITIPPGIEQDELSGGRVPIDIMYSDTAYLTHTTLTYTSSGNQGGGMNPSMGNAIYIGDYVIGFARTQADGDIKTIEEGHGYLYGIGIGEQVPNPNNLYYPLWTLEILAGIKKTDGAGATYYEIADSSDVSISINKMWFETLSGHDVGFSLSPDGLEKEKLSGFTPNAGVPFYAKEGYDSAAKLYADIDVTINGSTTSNQTVSASVETIALNVNHYYRSDGDTVYELNTFLEDLAQSIDSDGAGIHCVHLANTVYAGTIVLPEEFTRFHTLHIYGDVDSDSVTTINGSINLNGARVEQISNIHFTAPDDSNTVALYGSGVTYVTDCSFFNYDVAISSTQGMINPQKRNIFVNNETAISIDIKNAPEEMSTLKDGWSGNTFINNTTAIDILSLNTQYSPYYIRIFDSNFIHNGTDFRTELDDTNTLYFYRNYYGDYAPRDGHRPHPGKHHPDHRNDHSWLHLNELHLAKTRGRREAILVSRPAIVANPNDCEVVTNPRRESPLKNWWVWSNIDISEHFFGSGNKDVPPHFDNEDEYRDILTADWDKNRPVKIDNAQAGNLHMDASAFEGDEEKEVEIVDGSSGKTIGRWKFD